jgi:phage tail-like protein
MNYPLARNRFMIDWGGTRTSAAEVSGMAIELDAPVARDSTSPVGQSVAMPGMVHFPRLVLRRTVMAGDNDFYNWINTALFNTITRREITISLLDSSASPAVVWKFANAFPVKLEYSPLESRNSGPMMEALEIVHEGMTVLYQ